MTIARCGCDSGLFCGQAPFTDELADEAVVVGELTQRAVVQEVRARVADVADEQAAASGDDDRRHRRSHAGELRVAGRAFEDRLVREGDRVVDRPAVRHRGAQRFDGSPRARPRPRHDRPSRRRSRTAPADRRRRARPRCCRGRVPRPRTRPPKVSCAFGRSTVWPTCSWSPLRTRAGCATCLPFRNVPFVEPRSSR